MKKCIGELKIGDVLYKANLNNEPEHVLVTKLEATEAPNLIRVNGVKVHIEEREIKTLKNGIVIEGETLYVNRDDFMQNLIPVLEGKLATKQANIAKYVKSAEELASQIEIYKKQTYG